MITAGIDIGSMSCKMVLMEEGEIRNSKILSSGTWTEDVLKEAYSDLLKECGRKESEVDAVISTGYGRVNVPFADRTITEITCHAAGNHWYFPNVRTILDMGGQDCKAIRTDAEGRVVNFVMNGRCAAGTGRYLERIARLLKTELDEIGKLSLQSKQPAVLSNTCLVHAEQNVQRLILEGTDRADILAGACDHIVKRMISLINQIGGAEEDFCISGGVAANIGIVKRLNEELKITAKIAPTPQLAGAIGAAVLAAREIENR